MIIVDFWPFILGFCLLVSMMSSQISPFLYTSRYFRQTKTDYNPAGWLNYEVLYPDVFTPDHPGFGPPSKREAVPGLKIPIYKLSHVTHYKQADTIASMQQDSFCFQPRPKLGKDYARDGTPMGESYTFDFATDQFNYVPKSSSSPLLPGYYSWWGISAWEWLTSNSKEAQTAIRNTRMFEPDIPSYLQDPPSSRYGSVEFSSSLSDMLQSYQTSRKCRDVHLKLTGTLRYKTEICYVVSVCSSMDAAMKDFQQDLSATSVFIGNGLLDYTSGGKVVDRKKEPLFCPKFVDTANNWAQLVFAFYFPNQQATFNCPKSRMQREDVDHVPQLCIRKEVRAEGDRLCPDYSDCNESSSSEYDDSSDYYETDYSETDYSNCDYDDHYYDDSSNYYENDYCDYHDHYYDDSYDNDYYHGDDYY